MMSLYKFQSLSGLTLCCDQKAFKLENGARRRFQSLSGLTLCCDRRSRYCHRPPNRSFNPFQG